MHVITYDYVARLDLTYAGNKYGLLVQKIGLYLVKISFRWVTGFDARRGTT